MTSNVNDTYRFDIVFSFVIFLRLVGTIYKNVHMLRFVIPNKTLKLSFIR